MPAWSMGKSARRMRRLRVTLVESPYVRRRESVPGPGQYGRVEYGRLRARSPSWTMGAAHRSAMAKVSAIPGPGAYDTGRRVPSM